MGKHVIDGISYSGGGAKTALTISYDDTNTNIGATTVQGAVEALNSNLKVIDTNSDNKLSFYTVDGTTIGLPSGYYKVMTVSNFEGTEGYQIATGYYGANAIDKMFRRTFVYNVYNEWDELITKNCLAPTDGGYSGCVLWNQYNQKAEVHIHLSEYILNNYDISIVSINLAGLLSLTDGYTIVKAKDALRITLPDSVVKERIGYVVYVSLAFTKK